MEIKKIVSENLTRLRKNKKLTQMELAERFNYSDKAISKWESGESTPNIEVLHQLCKFYNVSLDDICTQDMFTEETAEVQIKEKINKYTIVALLVSCVYILATSFFAYFDIMYDKYIWELFLWALPISIFGLIIFNCIWGRRKWHYILMTLFIWSLLGSIYFQFLSLNLWIIFIVGLPIQIAIVLFSKMRVKTKKIAK